MLRDTLDQLQAWLLCSLLKTICHIVERGRSNEILYVAHMAAYVTPVLV